MAERFVWHADEVWPTHAFSLAAEGRGLIWTPYYGVLYSVIRGAGGKRAV